MKESQGRRWLEQDGTEPMSQLDRCREYGGSGEEAEERWGGEED